MRNRTIPLPRQVWRVRLGPDPGHCHQRQAAETRQRRVRQLHHQVSLDLQQPWNLHLCEVNFRQCTFQV